MLAENMNLQALRTFSLVKIDKVHKQKTPILCSFLQVCVDSHNSIIDNSNLDLADAFSLFCNNMVNLSEIKEQILTKHNRALISIISLVLLSYTQNKRSNLFQRVIGYYAFSGKILKHSVELLY